MTRTEFIETMKAQVESLKAERDEIIKIKKGSSDFDAYGKVTKLGHEISAIENAIREMERKY